MYGIERDSRAGTAAMTECGGDGQGHERGKRWRSGATSRGIEQKNNGSGVKKISTASRHGGRDGCMGCSRKSTNKACSRDGAGGGSDGVRVGHGAMTKKKETERGERVSEGAGEARRTAVIVMSVGSTATKHCWEAHDQAWRGQDETALEKMNDTETKRRAATWPGRHDRYRRRACARLKNEHTARCESQRARRRVKRCTEGRQRRDASAHATTEVTTTRVRLLGGQRCVGAAAGGKCSCCSWMSDDVRVPERQAARRRQRRGERGSPAATSGREEDRRWIRDRTNEVRDGCV